MLKLDLLRSTVHKSVRPLQAAALLCVLTLTLEPAPARAGAAFVGFCGGTTPIGFIGLVDVCTGKPNGSLCFDPLLGRSGECFGGSCLNFNFTGGPRGNECDGKFPGASCSGGQCVASSGLGSIINIVQGRPELLCMPTPPPSQSFNGLVSAVFEGLTGLELPDELRVPVEFVTGLVKKFAPLALDELLERERRVVQKSEEAFQRAKRGFEEEDTSERIEGCIEVAEQVLISDSIDMLAERLKDPNPVTKAISEELRAQIAALARIPRGHLDSCADFNKAEFPNGAGSFLGAIGPISFVLAALADEAEEAESKATQARNAIITAALSAPTIGSDEALRQMAEAAEQVVKQVAIAQGAALAARQLEDDHPETRRAVAAAARAVALIPGLSQLLQGKIDEVLGAIRASLPTLQEILAAAAQAVLGGQYALAVDQCMGLWGLVGNPEVGRSALARLSELGIPVESDPPVIDAEEQAQQCFVGVLGLPNNYFTAFLNIGLTDSVRAILTDLIKALKDGCIREGSEDPFDLFEACTVTFPGTLFGLPGRCVGFGNDDAGFLCIPNVSPDVVKRAVDDVANGRPPCVEPQCGAGPSGPGPNPNAPRATPAANGLGGDVGICGGDCAKKNPAPDCSRSACQQVLPFNGQELRDETDMSIKGRDFVTNFEVKRRHFSGIEQRNSIFGVAWAFNYDQHFIQAFDGGLLMQSFGREDRYVQVAPNVWEGTGGRFDRLTYDPNAGTSALVMAGGTLLRFETVPNAFGFLQGQLSAIESPAGNKLELFYDENEPELLEQRLIAMLDSFGRLIEFHYDDPDYAAGASRIIDFSGREYRYDYNALGQLLSVRTPTVQSTKGLNDFPMGKVTSYRYYHDVVLDQVLGAQVNAGLTLQQKLTELLSRGLQRFSVSLAAVVAPNQHAWGAPRLTWTYETNPASPSFGFVTTHTVGNQNVEVEFIRAGGTYAYSYEFPAGTGPNAVNVRTTVQDRRGTSTVLEFTQVGQLLRETIRTQGLRPDSPASEFTRSVLYNQNGDAIRETDPNGIVAEYARDDQSPSRRSQSNVGESRLLPIPSVGADQSEIKSVTVYEPIFNRPFKVIDPRGFEPGNDPASYTTTFVYDYMKNLDAAAAHFAARFNEDANALRQRMSESGLTSVGDVNGDGQNQFAGNVVQIIHPPVTLPVEAARIGLARPQQAVELFTFNEFGQKTSHIDAEGNRHVWFYCGAADPDCDSVADVLNPPPASFAAGGYLSVEILDAEQRPGRNSGQNPPAVAKRTQYLYTAHGESPANRRGVPTAIIDPRGIEHTFLINELDQVVMRWRAADVSASTEPGLVAHGYMSSTTYDHNDNVSRHGIENRDTLDGDRKPILDGLYLYDILDRMRVEVRDEGGLDIATSFGYDASENRIRMTRAQPFENNPDNPVNSDGEDEVSATHFTYDERDRPIVSLRGAGRPYASVSSNRIDRSGNVVAEIDSTGDAQQMTRDGFDRVQVITDREGNTTHFRYDAASNVVSKEVFGSFNPFNPAQREKLSSERWTYDTRNRLMRHDRAAFDFAGQGSGTPPDGGDLAMREGQAQPTAARIFVRDRLGREVAMVNADDDTYAWRYDGAGRKIAATDPAGNEVEWTYDDNDNLLQTVEVEVDGNVLDEFVTTRRYDSLNRLAELVEPNGQSTTFEYDSRDNLVRKTDELGNRTEWLYDRLNRELEERIYLSAVDGREAVSASAANADPAQGGGDGVIVTKKAWDDLHRLKSRTDDNGKTTVWEYDDLDRKTKCLYPDGTVERWVYSTDDEVITHTDRNGSVFTYSYDKKSRPLRATVERAPGVIGTTSRGWGYDGLDRVTISAENNGDGTADDVYYLFSYDSLSRRTGELQVLGSLPYLMTSVHWRADSQRNFTKYPDGRIVRSTYDDLDREIEIVENDGTPIGMYDYIGGRDLSAELGNGTVLNMRNDAGTSTIAGPGAGYDDNRRNRNQRWLASNDELITGHQSEYNGVNVFVEERREHLGRGDLYTLDSTYRTVGFAHNQPMLPDGSLDSEVLPEDESRWTLDGANNWQDYIRRQDDFTVVVDSSGGVNEYSAFHSSSIVHNELSYDNNGNLTHADSRNYHYDAWNRLVEVNDGYFVYGRYIYDADNRRVMKQGGLGDQYRYLYRDWEVIEERDNFGPNQSWRLARQYVYRTGIDRPVLYREIAGAFPGDYYYHLDPRGNVAALTNAAEDVVYYAEYDAYGGAASGQTPLFGPNDIDTPLAPIMLSLVPNPFLWQARHLDGESGNYYFRHRYYNPERGRFLQGDPLGAWYDEANFGNRYAFGGNVPGARDPMGLDSQCPGGCHNERYVAPPPPPPVVYKPPYWGPNVNAPEDCPSPGCHFGRPIYPNRSFEEAEAELSRYFEYAELASGAAGAGRSLAKLTVRGVIAGCERVFGRTVRSSVDDAGRLVDDIVDLDMLDDSPRVISAHGRWEDGYFTMPEGTSLTLHSPHGALIDHKLGNAIEQGLMESGWSQTYRSGDKVRNYVLTRLPADKVVGNPIQPPPGTRTTLKDVLKPGMGECHGSFCRWEIGHTLDSETWTQQTWQSLDHLLEPPPAGSLR